MGKLLERGSPTTVKINLFHVECPRCGQGYVESLGFICDNHEYVCNDCGYAELFSVWPIEEYTNVVLTIREGELGELTLSAEEDYD